MDNEAKTTRYGPQRVFLQRRPDGSFVDWGRHATVGGVRGEGGARLFAGEAAEVMALVLKHTGKRDAR